MMKKHLATILIASTFGALATPAMAQLGGFLNASNSSNATSTVSPEVFVTSAQQAEKMMNNSVALLSRSLISNEQVADLEAQRKAASEITDPAEKAAKLTEIRKTELASLNEAVANSKFESNIKKMASKQREDFAAASFNFMLALLQDKALVEQGKGLVSSLSSNPMNVSKLGGVKDAVTSMGNQISAASNIAGKMPAVFTAVGVKAPASKDDKPKEVAQVSGE